MGRGWRGRNPAETANTSPRSSLIDSKSRIDRDATYRKQRVEVDSNRHFLRRAVRRFPIFSLILSGLIAAGGAWAIPAPKSSASQSASSKPVIAPDLAQQFAKFKSIQIRFDTKGLSAREKEMVEKLVDAAGLLDCIYWRQSDPEGLKLYLSLANSKDPRDQMLREYLKINGGRYDLINDNKPFVGTQPMPPGRGFFPSDLTRSAFDAYIAAHPAQKAALYNGQTMVRRKGSALEAVPYHVAFREFLVPMAADLRAAAALSDDPAFAKFLRLRADALLSDDYYPSDVAWMDLDNPKFDVIFAPYEVYLDGLLGVKTSYGASVMIRNDAESKKLAAFQKYVPDLQESLPLPHEDLPSERGQRSPMEVVDAIYRSGDLLHGYQAVADNLPNDPRIHQEKGSKKMFWKNFLDARVNFIILPLAERLMPADQAKMVTGEGTLDFVILHEISHGLGPTYVHGSNGKLHIGEAIGPRYSALEESKADITGLLCVKWLVDHGAIPSGKLNEIYASFLGETFRTIRFGIAESHGAGAMMEISYLTEQGAVRRNLSTGLYDVDFKKMPGAIASLAKELLEQEATGDRARTEKWFIKYAVMPPQLSAALAKGSDIPVDVDPQFDFHPPLR